MVSIATDSGTADGVGSGEAMLSTSDNPYNPHTHWLEWYTYDTMHGYHTSGYLARVVVSSDELSVVDQLQAIDDAMDEIIRENPYGNFIKIYANSSVPKK